MRRLRQLLAAGLSVYLATLLAGLLLQLVVTSGARGMPGPADAIVCLGAGLAGPVSALPDPSSRGRALTCARLHEAGAAPIVVFTGAGNPVVSAAEAMAATARDAGVPEDAIRVDADAQSTLQNAAFAQALLPMDARHLIVVSDAFHLPRAWVIFRVLGTPQVDLHATERDLRAPLGTRIQWNLREAVVVWVNVGRLAAYGVAGALGVDRDTRLGWFN
jgi:uncharacterized SAM-binding protein YcdF (DUF218 family)